MKTPIDVSEEDGVRYLHFGSSWIQGAMRIARPWSLELEYTREMMLALLMRPRKRWPARVLIVGLGTGSVAKFLYRHYPASRLHVVEIEPRVVACARQFFRLPDDERRLSITIADASDYVVDTRHEFDLVLVDGFDGAGRAGRLDGTAFYSNVRARLSQAGVAALNFLGRNRGYHAASARLGEAFDGRMLALPPCASGNVIAFAAAGDEVRLGRDAIRDGVARLRRETSVNLAPHAARLLRAAGVEGEEVVL